MERALVDRRRGLGGWALGLSLYVALIVSLFPTVRDSESYAQAAEDYPEALKELFGGEAGFDNLTTGSGFVDVQLFALILPVLLAIAAIGYGAATLGGERERGVLDLVLANPVTRRRVVAEKASGLVLTVTSLGLVVGLVVAGLGAIVDLGVSAGNLTAATAGVVFVTILHGLVAMGAGAATGRRGSAVAIATVFFATGYLLNALAGLVDSLQPIRVLSPYHHYAGSSPIVNGWPVGNYVVLLVLCAAAFIAASEIFERTDLS